jgi:hypothetical protein
MSVGINMSLDILAPKLKHRHVTLTLVTADLCQLTQPIWLKLTIYVGIIMPINIRGLKSSYGH